MNRVGYLLALACGASLLATPLQGQEYEGCSIQQGNAQSAAARPSPLGETVITLGGQTAKLCYGRPSARGRTMVGGVNGFGQPWRLGANEATAIHVPFAAVIGSVRVDAGDYSLYVVPEEKSWQVFVNANAERWGIPINAQVRAEDVGSFEVAVSHIDRMVEELTFTWKQDGADAGHLVYEWEHNHVEIPVRLAGK